MDKLFKQFTIIDNYFCLINFNIFLIMCEDCNECFIEEDNNEYTN